MIWSNHKYLNSVPLKLNRDSFGEQPYIMNKIEDKRLMEKFFWYLFLSVWGYFFIRNLIWLYRAEVKLRKTRRDKENAYMNLITSMKESESIV